MAGVGWGQAKRNRTQTSVIGKRGEGATGGTRAVSSVLDSGMSLKCWGSQAGVGSSVGSSGWRWEGGWGCLHRVEKGVQSLRPQT